MRGMWGGTTTAERDQMRAAGQSGPSERYCRREHLMDEANTYWRTDGYPVCRQCTRDRQAARRAAKRGSS